MKYIIQVILSGVIILSFGHQTSQAQTQKNKLFIGTNLMHLLHNRAPAADFILGYGLTDRIALRASGGPLVNMHRTSNVPVAHLFQEKLIKVLHVKGWQAGLGARYNMFISEGQEYSLFSEVRGKLKNFQNTIAGDFQRKGYFQRINYTADIQIWDLQVGFGQAWQAKRFRMEFLVGLGLTNVNIKYGNIPDDASLYTNQVKEDVSKKLYEPGEPYKVYPNHLFTAEFTIGYLLF